MKLVLVLLLVQLGVHAYDAKHGEMRHECIHDKKMKNHKMQFESHVRPLPFKTSHANKRLSPLKPFQRNHKIDVSGVVWSNIRIRLDFSFAQRFLNTNPSVRSGYELSARLVQSVRAYFQSILKVRPSPSLTTQGMKCDELNIPAFSLTDTDLYIAIQPESDPTTSYFAAAVPCTLSRIDRRPTIGTYILNFAFIKVQRIYQYLYFSTFAHEFTHILGFSNYLFKEYINPFTMQPLKSVTTQMRIRSRTNPSKYEDFTVITLQPVVDYARAFFNCSSLTGIPLENNGGDGSANSHWEKLFLPSEYMNPTVENPGLITEFTFSLLRGTGWYQVDSNGVQFYNWGLYVGCDHFSICPVGKGYCTAAEAREETCSSDYTSKVGTTHPGILHRRWYVYFWLRDQETARAFLPD
jgi:leishmanolysin